MLSAEMPEVDSISMTCDGDQRKVMGLIRIALLNLLFIGGHLIAYAQPPAAPPPKYIPPSCQGKTLLAVPRSEMEVGAAPTSALNPPIKQTDEIKLFDALSNVINANYVYRDYNGQNWHAIEGEYGAKIEQGLDTEAFYAEIKKIGHPEPRRSFILFAASRSCGPQSSSCGKKFVCRFRHAV